MADVEGSGKTVEEAIQHGLAQLNELHIGRRFRREDVDIEVLSEGSKGILGMGGEPAHVLVRPLEAPVVAAAGALASGDVAIAMGDGDEEEPGEDEAEVAAQTLDHMLEIMGVRADVSIRDPETPGDGPQAEPADDNLADDGVPATISGSQGTTRRKRHGRRRGKR